MKEMFIVFAVITLAPATSAGADSNSDIAQFAQSICGDIPEGSLTRGSIQAKVEANATLLAKIISGGANVSGTRTDEIYKGIPFDKLPDKIPTISMCKSELVKLILTLEQGQGTVIQRTEGSCSPIQSGSGNTANCNNPVKQ